MASRSDHIPDDLCYHDQLGWLEGAGAEELCVHWPWGQIFAGALTAKAEMAILLEKIAESGHDTYAAYQESDPVKARYEKIFRSNPWLRGCWVCSVHLLESDRTRYGTDTHHLSYQRLGHEAPADLVKLCPSHHCEVHALEKSSGQVQCLAWYVAFLRMRVAQERQDMEY